MIYTMSHMTHISLGHYVYMVYLHVLSGHTIRILIDKTNVILSCFDHANAETVEWADFYLLDRYFPEELGHPILPDFFLV